MAPRNSGPRHNFSGLHEGLEPSAASCAAPLARSATRWVAPRRHAPWHVLAFSSHSLPALLWLASSRWLVHARRAMFMGGGGGGLFGLNCECVACLPERPAKRGRRPWPRPAAQILATAPGEAEPLFLLERLAHIRCLALTLAPPSADGMVRIKIAGRDTHVGYYADEADAALAFDR